MKRKTTHISRKMVQNVLRAFDYARAIGVPFNISVVLHLHETDARSASAIFELIRDKYRDWLAHKSKRLGVKMPPMYVFSFEAPGNPHVNWVLRIPPQLLPEFRKKLPRWVAKAQGPLGPTDLDVTDMDPAGGYKALANYMLKGCDPAFIDHFHLRALFDEHGPQGEFWGKRAGVCPAFNKAARAAARYDDKRRRLRPSPASGATSPARASKAA
jgi:hypothetical protein